MIPALPSSQVCPPLSGSVLSLSRGVASEGGDVMLLLPLREEDGVVCLYDVGFFC